MTSRDSCQPQPLCVTQHTAACLGCPQHSPLCSRTLLCSGLSPLSRSRRSLAQLAEDTCQHGTPQKRRGCRGMAPTITVCLQTSALSSPALQFPQRF